MPTPPPGVKDGTYQLVYLGQPDPKPAAYQAAEPIERTRWNGQDVWPLPGILDGHESTTAVVALAPPGQTLQRAREYFPSPTLYGGGSPASPPGQGIDMINKPGPRSSNCIQGQLDEKTISDRTDPKTLEQTFNLADVTVTPSIAASIKDLFNVGLEVGLTYHINCLPTVHTRVRVVGI